MGALSQFVALALLLPDVQKSDAGALHLQHITAVDVAEQGELVQIGRLAVHVGPHVQHQHRLSGVLGGKQRTDGGPIDPLEPPQPEDR